MDDEKPLREVPVQVVLQEFVDMTLAGPKPRWVVVYRAAVDGQTVEAVSPIQWQSQDTPDLALSAFANGLRPNHEWPDYE